MGCCWEDFLIRRIYKREWPLIVIRNQVWFCKRRTIASIGHLAYVDTGYVYVSPLCWGHAWGWRAVGGSRWGWPKPCFRNSSRSNPPPVVRRYPTVSASWSLVTQSHARGILGDIPLVASLRLHIGGGLRCGFTLVNSILCRPVSAALALLGAFV